MQHTDAISPPALALWHRLTGSRVTDDFCLGGGTALAWHFGHRVSVDLDFFTQEEFDPMELQSQLVLQVPVDLQVVKASRNTLLLHMDRVKVDLLRYAYPLLEPPHEWEGKRILALPDLAAMKLSAAANRGTKKDFYDLAALLERFSLQELLDFYQTKFPTFSSLPVVISLTYFTDAEADPDPVSLVEMTWPEVQARITAASRTIS